MKITRIITAAIVASTLAVAPAFAQGSFQLPGFTQDRNIVSVHHTKRYYKHRHGYSQHHVLPKRAIYGALYRAGFHKVQRIHYAGGRYYVHAYGHRGFVQLTVNARTGHIIGRKMIRPYHKRGFHFRFH